MAASNDSIAVTPGSGAVVATHLVGGKEHQVVMLAGPDGHIQGSSPVYRLRVPASTVGANKVHCDLFNASGSGVTIRVLAAFCFPDIDTAVTGVVAAEVALTRTTAVGTGGTTAAANEASLTLPGITSMDTDYAALPAQITARSGPAGGATAGAVVAQRWVFTEETNAGSAIAAAIGAEFVRNEGAELYVRQGTGLRFVQGAVASVGTLSFEITFELI
jgi:hypothetical protein